MNIVEFHNVDIIFGQHPNQALALLDQGRSREEILAETGNVVGVAGASFDIEKGETCVLMGLSGSGKSTLLRGVNGLNKVTRGKILLEDDGDQVDVTRCSHETLRELRMNRISMVFQQFGLLPWRTVSENVGLGLELRGMPKADRINVVEEKLALVGLEQWKNKYAHELSGGMQQRVGLARAFATDADVLLMDEPFSALDPLIRTHLQNELLDLQHTLKKTIIFVSHDLDEALKLGTHIVIMEGGRVVQYGEPEQIVLNPASQYVCDFVAHMNPLNVLRGTSLMTPVGELERQNGQLRLDWSGHVLMQLDASGKPTSVTLEGRPGKLRNFDSKTDLNALDDSRDLLITASADILMKTVIEIRHRSGRPIALLEDGHFIGVIGDDEIYRGMLRQTGIADEEDAG